MSACVKVKYAMKVRNIAVVAIICVCELEEEEEEMYYIVIMCLVWFGGWILSGIGTQRSVCSTLMFWSLLFPHNKESVVVFVCVMSFSLFLYFLLE